jgi:hypothetical protein
VEGVGEFNANEAHTGWTAWQRSMDNEAKKSSVCAASNTREEDEREIREIRKHN